MIAKQKEPDSFSVNFCLANDTSIFGNRKIKLFPLKSVAVESQYAWERMHQSQCVTEVKLRWKQKLLFLTHLVLSSYYGYTMNWLGWVLHFGSHKKKKKKQIYWKLQGKKSHFCEWQVCINSMLSSSGRSGDYHTVAIKWLQLNNGLWEKK